MEEETTAKANERYHRSLRTYRTLPRKSKRIYEKRIASEAKTAPKMFFAFLRTKKKVKSTVSQLTDENGILTQESKHTAKILNRNFTSVFTEENTETVPLNPAPP